jgi:DNA polymerase-3 subunit beta
MQGTGMSVGGHETPSNQTIVPARALALVSKALSDLDDDDTVNFVARQSDIVVQTQRSTVTCRLVEGKFPNWKNVIPTRKDPTLVEIAVGPFFSAIRRAAIVANVETHGLNFKFADDALVISAKTANLGTSRVRLPIPYSRKPIEMMLDYRYLGDFLRMLDSESACTASIASSSEAILLTTEDGYQYVVMPMALER